MSSKSLALRSRVPAKTSRQTDDAYFQLDLIAAELVEQFDEVIMRRKPPREALLPAVKQFLANVESFDLAHSEAAQWPRRDLCDNRKERQIAYDFVVEKIFDLVESFSNARPKAFALKVLIRDVWSANPSPVALERACNRYRHSSNAFAPSAVGELLPFLIDAEEKWIDHRKWIGTLGHSLEFRRLLLEQRETKQIEPPRELPHALGSSTIAAISEEEDHERN
jgi:hypothetical protein